MKRELKGFIFGVALSLSVTMAITSFANGNFININAVKDKVKVKLNGKYINAENYVINGRTYTQLRSITDALKLELVWDGENNEAIIRTKDYIAEVEKPKPQMNRDELIRQLYGEEALAKEKEYEEPKNVMMYYGELIPVPESEIVHDGSRTTVYEYKNSGTTVIKLDDIKKPEPKPDLYNTSNDKVKLTGYTVMIENRKLSDINKDVNDLFLEHHSDHRVYEYNGELYMHYNSFVNISRHVAEHKVEKRDNYMVFTRTWGAGSNRDFSPPSAITLDSSWEEVIDINKSNFIPMSIPKEYRYNIKDIGSFVPLKYLAKGINSTISVDDNLKIVKTSTIIRPEPENVYIKY